MEADNSSQIFISKYQWFSTFFDLRNFFFVYLKIWQHP